MDIRESLPSIIRGRYVCNQASLEPSKDEIRLAKMLKALGNPTRLLILYRLANCSPCFCSEIVSNLPKAQSTVSQHLNVLREAGLIIRKEEGTATCYYPDANGFLWFREQVTHLIGDLIDQAAKNE
jgi:ArsR family transcriptional regulator, arsenate/arsenite/antimonite-responsive transcriptional repressor